MYNNDQSQTIARVTKFAKWLRILYAIVFVYYILKVIFAVVYVTPNLGDVNPVFLILIGIAVLVLVGLISYLLIYFFRYFGKVARQTQNGISTDSKPALVSVMICGVALLRTLRAIPVDGALVILDVAIILVLGYLGFAVYRGLKKIEDKGYFAAANNQTAPSQTTTSTQNDTWIKED